MDWKRLKSTAGLYNLVSTPDALPTASVAQKDEYRPVLQAISILHRRRACTPRYEIGMENYVQDSSTIEANTTLVEMVQKDLLPNLLRTYMEETCSDCKLSRSICWCGYRCEPQKHALLHQAV
ncbi:MAG: hypothetical protein ACLU4P_04575 [Ruminococcus sp.]